LLAAMLFTLPAAVAHADDPDFCTGASARAALPTLQDSFNWAPSGYGPFGYEPVTFPFGVGPFGNAAYFVPGAAPSAGPLGPGLTANYIIGNNLLPNGFNPFNIDNVGTVTSLAALQQAELGTLNGRYANAALYQTANATWAGARATQAGAVFTIYQAMCANPLPAAPPLAVGAAAAAPVANGVAAPVAGAAMAPGAAMTPGAWGTYPGMPMTPAGSPWGPRPMMPGGMMPTVSNGTTGQ
jgi:hypothetical protein